MSDTTVHTVFDDEHDEPGGREDRRAGGEVVPFARAAREQDRTTSTRGRRDAGEVDVSEVEVPDVLGDLADEHDTGSAGALVQQPGRPGRPGALDDPDDDR